MLEDKVLNLWPRSAIETDRSGISMRAGLEITEGAREGCFDASDTRSSSSDTRLFSNASAEVGSIASLAAVGTARSF